MIIIIRSKEKVRIKLLFWSFSFLLNTHSLDLSVKAPELINKETTKIIQEMQTNSNIADDALNF